MNKVKLLFLCNAPKVLGGVETALVALFHLLDREEFEVTFLITGYGPFYERLVEIGARPIACECRGRYSLSWHRFLSRHLAEHSYDVVHLTAPLPNVFLLRWHSLKIVARLNYPRMKYGWYPMRFKALDLFCSQFFDAYVVVSRAIQMQFTKRGYDPQKLHLIYNGIKLGSEVSSSLRAELGISSDQMVVGTIGRMRYEKGMDLFLGVAGELSQQFPNLQFVIAGEGEQRTELEAMARVSGLGGRIHFLGFRSDPLNVLAGFDVLLYLSRWEAFSNTILEAMSLGIPVVASAVGGNTEAIMDGTTGLLVPAEDRPAALTAVSSLLRNADQRTAIINGAAVSVREFSVETMVHKHEALFKSLATR
ncbi:hypothetical protein CCP3SC15_1120003 [Gammaproteobacteria bacterium]